MENLLFVIPSLEIKEVSQEYLSVPRRKKVFKKTKFHNNGDMTNRHKNQVNEPPVAKLTQFEAQNKYA